MLNIDVEVKWLEEENMSKKKNGKKYWIEKEIDVIIIE
jgi:hypothetical protein